MVRTSTRLGILAGALLMLLFQSPAKATLNEQCPTDLGFTSQSCVPSISFGVFDTSITNTFNPLLVVPIVTSPYQNDYLIAVTNNSSSTIYGVILSTDPYVTADTGAIGSSCAGSSDGYAATALVCDPLGTISFVGGLAPGKVQGFALEFLPAGPRCGTPGNPPCIFDPAITLAAIDATRIVQVNTAANPEPATLALMGSGFGLFGLGMWRKRRRLS